MTNDKAFILKARRLFAGTGGPLLEGVGVLVVDGRIASMGRAAEIAAPDGIEATVIDYGEATIMPGLVDGHTHMMAPGDGTPGDVIARDHDDLLLMRALQNARMFLNAGVTTARENGAKNRVGFSLKEGIKRGLAQGPDMVVCGRPVTITGGHFWYCGSEADGIEGVRQEVRQLVKEGADFIKIMATGGSTWSSHANRPAFNVDELRVIVDEAHKFGKLTAAHCANVFGIQNSLAAGVDMIIHCVFEDETGMYEYRPDIAEKLAAARAWVNPTLHVVEAGIEHVENRGRERGWLTDAEKLQIDASKRSLETRFESVRKLSALGVRMIAGSDSPWGAYPPGEFVEEVEALNRAGLSNTAALVTATSWAAESIAASDRAGTLMPGRPADLIIVDGNPVEDLAALRRVRDVFKGGVQVARGVV